MKSHIVPCGPLASRTFSAYLRAELGRRCSDNPGYSLRAFATDLCHDHSSLSQLLRGRRRWSERAIRQTAARLGLGEERITAFVRLEQAAVSASGADASVRLVRSLTRDALAIMSSFEHEAILELTRLKGFRPDVRWIARTLDVSVDRVNVALQQLLRLGMLEMRDASTWVDLTGDSTLVHADPDGSSEACGDLARAAVLRLAERVRRQALDVARRGGDLEYTASTLAVDASRVPEALERVARFRRELLDLLTRGERRDAVVHLEFSFLPLTRNPDDDKE